MTGTFLVKAAHEGKPRVDFSRPAGISEVTVDRRTGELPYPDDDDVVSEVFLAGTEPSVMALRAPAPPASADAGVGVSE
jgi:penicillin-binding protein 1A